MVPYGRFWGSALVRFHGIAPNPLEAYGLDCPLYQVVPSQRRPSVWGEGHHDPHHVCSFNRGYIDFGYSEGRKGLVYLGISLYAQAPHPYRILGEVYGIHRRPSYDAFARSFVKRRDVSTLMGLARATGG